MYKAELYSRFSNLQRRDVLELLQTSMKLMKFRETDVIADLGCANGDITRGILLEEIPTFSNMIGIDLSEEMLQFARTKNAHPRINYVHMDLGQPNVPSTFTSHIDHAFCFHVIHWIQNQEQLFDNIFQMLKPGGDFLAICILKCDLKYIFRELVESSKWSPYMDDYSDVLFPYQESANPMKELEDVVAQAGFAHIIKTEERYYNYENLKDFQISMESVMPFLKHIPTNRYPELMKDLVQVCDGFNFMSTPITPQSKVILPYLVAAMYLRKPYQ